MLSEIPYEKYLDVIDTLKWSWEYPGYCHHTLRTADVGWQTLLSIKLNRGTEGGSTAKRKIAQKLQ